MVGSGEGGYNKIVDSFKTDKIGGFSRILIVNPLHNKLPRLVLVVCCTCNCFDATWVWRQWNVVDCLWLQEYKNVVEPVIGQANDGDNRRRELMLSDYKRVSGERFKVNWPGWVFSATLDDEGHVRGLDD